MTIWNKTILGALTGLGVMSVAHAYGPGNPASYTSVPPGFTECAADGKVCKVPAGATAYVVYGAGSNYATSQGTGDFTCLPKGWVKTAGQPPDLGVDDPAPKVAKKCYLLTSGGSASTGAATPTKPATTTTSTTPQTSTSQTTSGSSSAASSSAAQVPSGYTQCKLDSKSVCKVGGATTVYYGAGTKYAVVPVKGDFSCLPKGWVKTAGVPPDLGVDDPAPGVQKACHVPSGSTASSTASAAATTTTTTTQTSSSSTSTASIPGCNAYKGTIFNAASKQYISMAQLNGNYANNTTLDIPKNATVSAVAEACAKQCGAKGEPAPCAWFSVTKWLSTVSATGKDSIVYVCHMFNDRNLKQITTPSLPKEVNLGTPDNAARFNEAHSFACRI